MEKCKSQGKIEEKKQYAKPELSSFGKISQLTAGGSMGAAETSSTAMSPAFMA